MICEPETVDITGHWRKLHSEEIHDFYSSSNIIRGTLLVAQLIEALRYKPEGGGFDY